METTDKYHNIVAEKFLSATVALSRAAHALMEVDEVTEFLEKLKPGNKGVKMLRIVSKKIVNAYVSQIVIKKQEEVPKEISQKETQEVPQQGHDDAHQEQKLDFTEDGFDYSDPKFLEELSAAEEKALNMIALK